MYIPASFRVENPAVLHDLMRQFSFATLVTNDDNGRPFASHLPFLLDAERGPHGTLRAHMARANPQWRQFREGSEALVIFQGPHAYISPSWYEVHPSVPTWNYAVVHAYGVPRLLGEEALYLMLKDLVNTYESGFERPWSFDEAEAHVGSMLRAIVGFDIEITRLEGKFKLSQNRSQADKERVIAALEQAADPFSAELAAWMRDSMPSGDGSAGSPDRRK
ncbi:MAG TPA: FMN-binding negative transcriptional regulator [Chthonomonadaceae bacterium]|nr:FMN-binding negative transcriptional regulator [Chthonomonadaceae bacterium]